MRILITGDRTWGSNPGEGKAMVEALTLIIGEQKISALIFIHGNADGADRMAGRWLERQGYHVAAVSAVWKKWRKAAGPMRNHAMTLLQPDLVVGFHRDIRESRGTGDMLCRAERLGVDYCLVEGLES